MDAEPAKPRRPRGRPPRSEGVDTRRLLIEAASAVCAECGFDGTTLALVAERAGVHSTAIYNHFDSREDLLYAAAVRALEQITEVSVASSGDLRSLYAIPAAYLRPRMAQQRRLLAEIHVASTRHKGIAELLAQWHRLWTEALLESMPPDIPNPRATVKTLYLLLLGLCHVDDLSAVRASRTAIVELAEQMVRTLVPEPDGTQR